VEEWGVKPVNGAPECLQSALEPPLTAVVLVVLPAAPDKFFQAAAGRIFLWGQQIFSCTTAQFIMRGTTMTFRNLRFYYGCNEVALMKLQ